ncbi:hypothetical protein [Archaeoglobus veneficus]|uniref:Lipoprotein n=1 Tax=Archaeoglobus veneficus (strain DSM 11195 / SNP6) TaxID=693661 RepID=F2KQL0_ARCVS|nr:hypothetical protein [Archaeoglobus veneficus]AEA47743.1 hypothetical protein Arcve_1746 [Archaeoglobus veneficus SNP6]
MRKIWLVGLFLTTIFTACVTIPTPEPEKTPRFITPIPPQETVHRFVRYYNERNSSMLYSLFSEKVRANHTVEEVENHLRLAEVYGVKIVEWKQVGKERILHPYRFLNVSFILQLDGNVSNVTVLLPTVFENGDFLIDKWIFRELGWEEIVMEQEQQKSVRL